MAYDFSDAPQQSSGDLIPAKTLCKVVLTIRPGQFGEDGLLTQSKSGFEYLSLEATVLSEPYARRKVFQNVGVGGTTESHEKAAQISRSLLRGILESARGIASTDESELARKARRINSFGDLIEMEFAAEIGIEKGKDGYDDKNNIKRAVTAEHPMYKKIMAGESVVSGQSKPAASEFVAPPAGVVSSAKPAGNPIPDWAR
jgi:hypothetical protein